MSAHREDKVYDLLVVGGGINGVGIARDASGRGLSVFLCEKNDLASATSSASTKLIHGGLRYLEYFEFRLVREALIERETLLEAAPHIIWPMRFILPHHKGLRPAWMLRLGLFLYDNIGGRKNLPSASSLDLKTDPAGKPLKPSFIRGFEYSDCWVDDARLVALNAIDARNRGAKICTRTKLLSARRQGDIWLARVQTAAGDEVEVKARALINAAGPWVGDVADSVSGSNTPSDSKLRLVKGSHAIVRKVFEDDRAYIFQNGDGRILFAIPYENDFTLLGTTDDSFNGDKESVKAQEDEVRYILDAVGEYFDKPIHPEDVVHTYAGVRPLYDDSASKSASAVTRDYVFDVEGDETQAPLLSIYGGKITTYRKLAEHALEKILPKLGNNASPWTKNAPLPGGDMHNADFDAFLAGMLKAYSWADETLIRRLARSYGTRLSLILGEAKSMADLGESFGGGLTEAEVSYLLREEWAQTAEDVLWRRSKLGLHLSPDAASRIDAWISKNQRVAA